MALLDFLKNKEEEGKKKKRTPRPRKVSAVSKPEKTPEKPKTKPAKFAFSYELVKEPHISEKSTILYERNQYVFKVSDRAVKSEIKKSVEGIYGVSVLSVNIIKIPPKKRRIGRTEGFRKAYTKAVVKIADGQKIEIL